MQAQRFHTGARALSFTDSSRNNRSVHAQVFYPGDSTGDIGKGNFPVLIFAHAHGINFTEYDYFWHSLVGNGYVIIFPTTETGTNYDVNAMSGDLLAIWDRMRHALVDTTDYYHHSLNGILGLVGHGLGGTAAILAAAQQPEGCRSLATFSALNESPAVMEAARKLTVPYLSIGTTSECLGSPEIHQFPILEACGSSYKAWLQIKRGTFCQFGRSFDGTPCRDREELNCPSMPPTISRTQQQSVTLLAVFPFNEFLLRSQCDHWQYYWNFARNPSTHKFQEWGTQPKPQAEFTMEQTGSAIWLTNHSISALQLLWDFGDGKTSLEKHPTHLYTKVDTYELKLYAVALNGCQDSMSKTITGLSAVELLGFRAKSEEGRIVLDWATATESENAYFVIERSINGIDFHDYAKIPGEMSSLDRKNYVFEDPSLPSGIYFYKLRQETTYDSITYSELVQVKHQLSISLSITDFNISVPDGRLGIGFHCENAGETVLRLLSPKGTMVFSTDILAHAGRNESSFAIPHFKPGLYILTATQRRETAHKTIFIR
jgi:PKD repeat protein